MKTKKLISAMMIVFVLASMMPLTLPQTVITAEAATVKLNKTKASLYVNESVQLKIKGSTKKVTWSSSKKSVATVNSKGEVIAKKSGSAIISAKVEGKTYKCKITVEKSAYLSVNAKSINLKVGESKNFMVTSTMTYLDVNMWFESEYEVEIAGAVEIKWDEDWTSLRTEENFDTDWQYGFTVTGKKPGKSLLIIYQMHDDTEVGGGSGEMDRIVIPVVVAE